MTITLNQKLAALSLLVFFGMVWLPLGQHEFVVDHWMKIGAFLAPILIFAGFKGRREGKAPWITDVSLMAYLLAASYLIHQIEEHWIDLLGREYPLYEFLNGLLAKLFGDDKFGILTRQGIFYINAGMVWTAALLAILSTPKRVFPALAMAGIMLVNGVAHGLNAIIMMEYNSGLATGVFLFLPLSITFFRAMLKSDATYVPIVVAAVIWGFLGHVLLVIGLVMANVFGLIPVPLYYMALILWGTVPVFMFRSEV